MHYLVNMFTKKLDKEHRTSTERQQKTLAECTPPDWVRLDILLMHYPLTTSEAVQTHKR